MWGLGIDRRVGEEGALTDETAQKRLGECRDDKKRSRGEEEREVGRQIDKRENGMLFHFEEES